MEEDRLMVTQVGTPVYSAAEVLQVSIGTIVR